MDRKLAGHTFAASVLGAALALTGQHGQAQGTAGRYPVKPIRLVDAFPPALDPRVTVLDPGREEERRFHRRSTVPLGSVVGVLLAGASGLLPGAHVSGSGRASWTGAGSSDEARTG